MRITRPQTLRNGFSFLTLLLLSLTGWTQTTSLTMTLQQAIQTAPNVLEYDVMLTNTGTTTLALRGYSCGVNFAAGMSNGGTLTHTFVSRDPLLSTLPSVTPGYTASGNHLRITTLNATAGNEVVLTAGLPVRLATMRVTNTVSFPPDFNPSLSLQMITAPAKTLCIATCIVTPPGTNYAINAAGNTPSGGTLQALSGVTNTPCFFLNPGSAFVAANTAVTPVSCFGQSTGSADVTLSGIGSAAPGGTTGTYQLNGGSPLAYAGNPLTVQNLSAGTHTITVTTSYGCSDTAEVIITQPSSGISSSFNAFICTGPYTLPWGTVINAAGIYTHTYAATNGCDSIVTANITSGMSTGNVPTTATACDSYIWNVNNQTYTASGTYVAGFTNVAGCDSNFVLNLIINSSSVSSISQTACDTYTWSQSGLTYTTSGAYTAIGTTAQGCTDTQTLFLTIKNSSYNTVNASSFTSYTWAVTGQTYTGSGVYTFTAMNAVGCDSVLSLNLTILQVAVTMTLQNAVQTAPNVFEYDVVLNYSGNTTLALRSYSFGVNHAAGMSGGGTMTHSFISRAATLSTIPLPTFSYTAATNHMRLTTTNATAGNEVILTPGVPVRLATMRMTSTATFPSDFNPSFTLQTVNASGKTQCIATCIVTPPGANYAINGAGNLPIAGTLQALSGVVQTPCFYLNPVSVFTANVTATTPVLCLGLADGSAQITLSGAGSVGTTGTYKLNGGADMAYAGNPFTLSNLAAGTYTVSVVTTNGCQSAATFSISSASTITASSSTTACESYVWGGSTYTTSGVYTQTFTAVSGCDSIHTLNLIVNESTTGSSSLTACESYTWNGTTYTNSASPSYVYTNVNGCDSVHTLNLFIAHGNTGSSTVTACDSYTWNGNTYTVNSAPVFVYSNTDGCDSVHTLYITVNQASSSTVDVTAASTYTWPLNNMTYTVSGMYTFTSVNAAGCDSIITLHLSLLTLTVSPDQEVSCFGNNDGSVSSSASGGSGNFTYDIDGANSFTNVTGFFQGLTPGVHTVCAKEVPSNLIVCATVTVIEPDPLTATFSIDSAVSCTGGGGQISISISGGTADAQPYLTLWTNTNGDTLNDQTTDLYAITVGGLQAGAYHVRIEDDHGCVLHADTTLLPAVCGDTLQLKLFIEGYYAGSSLMNPVMLNQGESLSTTICDSITVELHEANSPYGLIDTRVAILHTDGTTSAAFGNIADPCYVVVKHRNGLQTWSANPVVFSSSSVVYDFTTAATQAYGDNQREMEPGVWAIYSGDINGDENMDLLDNTPIELDVFNFQFGYLATDLNGDGNVDLLDLPILEDNVFNFVYSIHP